MLNIAACESYCSDTVREAIEKITSGRLDVTIRYFQNETELVKTVSEGGRFNLFMLDSLSMSRIADLKDLERERFFLLSTRDRDIKLPYSSIICVESYHRVMTFHIEGAEPLSSRSIRKSFSAKISQLMEDGRFVCARKSFVINLEKVECVTDKSVVMSNGMEIFIPRYAFAEVKKRYVSYFSEK